MPPAPPTFDDVRQHKLPYYRQLRDYDGELYNMFAALKKWWYDDYTVEESIQRYLYKIVRQVGFFTISREFTWYRLCFSEGEYQGNNSDRRWQEPGSGIEIHRSSGLFSGTYDWYGKVKFYMPGLILVVPNQSLTTGPVLTFELTDPLFQAKFLECLITMRDFKKSMID